MNENICTVACLRHGGTHFIRPIVASFDFNIVEPGNFGAPLNQSIGPTIVFTRDPRNRMASTLRWWRKKPRKHDLLLSAGITNDTQMLYLLDKQGFLSEMMVWANIWCKWEKPHLRTYFELMDITNVSLIARELDLEYDLERDTKIFESVNKKSRTYTGNHSQWQDYFGPKSLRYWNNNNGKYLLQTMGYEE